MAHFPTRLARSVCGVAAFALFGACGGVSDPFSASSSAGTFAGVAHAGESSSGGASAAGGKSNAAESSAAGADSTDGGANNGGSGEAGANGAGAPAHAGASNAAGASHGGSTSSGGAASAGSAGAVATAGSSGGDGDTCAELLAQANKQLTAAQVCFPAADSPQCMDTVQSPCKCEVPVRRKDSDETKAYQDTLQQIEQKKCLQVCSAIACLPATHAQCSSSGSFGSGSGAPSGTCTASHALPL